MCIQGKIKNWFRTRFQRSAAVIAYLLLCTNSLEALEPESQGWFKGAELRWRPHAQAPNVRPTFHALVIGINKYKSFSDGSGWEPLLTGRPDAQAVSQLLEQEYGFEVQTLVDEDATRSNIMKAFDKIVHLTLDDAILVYFSGHGYYDKDFGEGFWIPQDARREDDGRSPTEEWLWNSTLTKIVGASQARHVLVVVDSCYAGSLFRGTEHIVDRHRFHWYRRANTRPSRYLLTSGANEPVPDGVRHSVFAQKLLNYLKYSEQDIFSASDIGKTLRMEVSPLTGTMVQMGPMQVSSHAGGEFVFMRKGAELQLKEAKQPEPDIGNDNASSNETRTNQEILQDAVLLKRRGAAESADTILTRLQSEHGETNDLLNVVANYLQPQKAKHSYDQLQVLIDHLEDNKHELRQPDWLDPSFARPRILVCTGPVSTSNRTDSTSLAMLYRICLVDALRQHPGTRIVDRDVFEEVVQEMRVATSVLSDQKAGLAVGNLLPASLILSGHVLSSEKGEHLYLRLVDTETTQVVDTILIEAEKGKSIVEVCRDAAKKIAEKAKEFRPLTVRIEVEQPGLIRAGIGNFHGVEKGMKFTVTERFIRDPRQPLEYDEQEIGTAELEQLGEWTSTFRPTWYASRKSQEQATLWIRE